MEEIDDHRQVVGGDQAGAVASAAVEMPVAGIERQREQAFRPPFETVGAAVFALHGCRAMAVKDIDDLLKEMALRRRFGPGSQIDDEHADEIAAPLQVNKRPIGFQRCPRPGLDLEQIDAEILNDGNALPAGPVQIGVEQKSRLRRVGHRELPFLVGRQTNPRTSRRRNAAPATIRRAGRAATG